MELQPCITTILHHSRASMQHMLTTERQNRTKQARGRQTDKHGAVIVNAPFFGVSLISTRCWMSAHENTNDKKGIIIGSECTVISVYAIFTGIFTWDLKRQCRSLVNLKLSKESILCHSEYCCRLQNTHISIDSWLDCGITVPPVGQCENNTIDNLRLKTIQIARLILERDMHVVFQPGWQQLMTTLRSQAAVVSEMLTCICTQQCSSESQRIWWGDM